LIDITYVTDGAQAWEAWWRILIICFWLNTNSDFTKTHASSMRTATTHTPTFGGITKPADHRISLKN